MADSLWVPTYFKADASLSAYMNILRRNLSTTCITRQTVACDITAVDPIRKYGIADVRVFWSKLPIKVENKTQERWFSTAKYSAMFVIVRAKWLWTSKKIMFSQSEVGRRFVAWGRRHQGWPTPIRKLTFSLHQHTIVWVWVSENTTMIDFATRRGVCGRSELAEVRSPGSCESFSRIIRSLSKLALFDIKSLV